MSPVSYYVCSNVDCEQKCTICFEDMKDNGDNVAHTRGGELHPLHRKCLEKMIEEMNLPNNPCPVCRASTDPSPVISLNTGSHRPLDPIDMLVVAGATVAGVIAVIGVAGAVLNANAAAGGVPTAPTEEETTEAQTAVAIAATTAALQGAAVVGGSIVGAVKIARVAAGVTGARAVALGLGLLSLAATGPLVGAMIGGAIAIAAREAGLREVHVLGGAGIGVGVALTGAVAGAPVGAVAAGAAAVAGIAAGPIAGMAAMGLTVGAAYNAGSGAVRVIGGLFRD